MANIKAQNTLCSNCYADVKVTQCNCDARTYTLVSWDCDKCGKEVVTSGGHDVDCSNCGACYNGFGQRLRSDWRDNPSNYDDEIGDLEGYEMQFASYYDC